MEILSVPNDIMASVLLAFLELGDQPNSSAPSASALCNVECAGSLTWACLFLIAHTAITEENSQNPVNGNRMVKAHLGDLAFLQYTQQMAIALVPMRSAIC